MSTLRIVPLLLALAAIAACDERPGEAWKRSADSGAPASATSGTYSGGADTGGSTGGRRFSVTLPKGFPAPTKGPVEYVETSAGRIPMNNAVSRGAGLDICYMAHGDVNDTVGRLSDAQLLDELERDAVDKAGGSVVVLQRADTSVSGHPARQMWLKLAFMEKPIFVRVDIVFARPRVYQISMGSADSAALYTETALRYFASFATQK